jgi:U4/U6.U5 tri-snRNP-associated protein 2
VNRFLNTLHRDLGGTKKKGSSPIHRTFQGEMKIMVETERKSADEKSDSKDDNGDPNVITKYSSTNFLYLSLDLPAAPLFKDGQDRIAIPQIPLFDLLAKFDGITPEVFISQYASLHRLISCSFCHVYVNV